MFLKVNEQHRRIENHKLKIIVRQARKNVIESGKCLKHSGHCNQLKDASENVAAQALDKVSQQKKEHHHDKASSQPAAIVKANILQNLIRIIELTDKPNNALSENNNQKCSGDKNDPVPAMLGMRDPIGRQKDQRRGMHGSGKQRPEQEFSSLVVQEPVTRRHEQSHRKRLLDRVEAEDVKPDAVPHQIAQPGTRRIFINQNRQHDLGDDGDHDQHPLKFSAHLMDDFLKPEKPEISAPVKDFRAEESALQIPQKACGILSQVAGQILISPAADKGMEDRHENDIILLFRSLLRHDEPEHQYGSNHDIIDVLTHTFLLMQAVTLNREGAASPYSALFSAFSKIPFCAVPHPLQAPGSRSRCLLRCPSDPRTSENKSASEND